jgi:hypothetical protein
VATRIDGSLHPDLGGNKLGARWIEHVETQNSSDHFFLSP